MKACQTADVEDIKKLHSLGIGFDEKDKKGSNCAYYAL